MAVHYSYFYFFLSIFFCNAAKLQKPVAHRPDDPVLYPKDYCEELMHDDNFDFIVIGSGPAGSTVARRLAETPTHKVLLFEAGGDPPPESDIPNKYEQSPDDLFWNISPEKTDHTCKGYPNETCPYYLAKVLGGCSVVNFMMYIRGNHEDFNELEAAGFKGWGYKSLLPYFLKLENFAGNETIDKKYHHRGGPFTTSYSVIDPKTQSLHDAFKASLQEKKIPINPDVNGESQIGFGKITAMAETTGYRNNIAKSYLLNIPDNLKVCKNALVTRLVLAKHERKSGKKWIKEVEFIYKGTKKRTAVATKEYIVAGGPANTPQILERSGIGQRKVLEKAGVKVIHELNGVGENLQEQYANLGCMFTVNLKNQVATNPISVAIRSFTGFLNMTDMSSPVPDLQFVLRDHQGFTAKPEIERDIKNKSKGKDLVIAMSMLLRQSDPGSVHILGTDPLAKPVFQVNQYATEKERKLQASGCRFMRKIFSSQKMAKFNMKPLVLKKCEKYPFNSDEELICAIELFPLATHHLVGTAKMGLSSDPMAVVDERLRVHGIEGLRVVDLSVVLKVPRGNTEIPTIAVAEKAADLIKEDYAP